MPDYTRDDNHNGTASRLSNTPKPSRDDTFLPTFSSPGAVFAIASLAVNSSGPRTIVLIVLALATSFKCIGLSLFTSPKLRH